MVAVLPVLPFSVDLNLPAGPADPATNKAPTAHYFSAPGSVTFGGHAACIAYDPACAQAGTKPRDIVMITEQRSFFQRLFGLCRGIAWSGQRVLTARESIAYRKAEALYDEFAPHARAGGEDGANASVMDQAKCLKQMRALMTRLADPRAAAGEVRNIARQSGEFKAADIEEIMIVPAVADAVWKDKATLRKLAARCGTIDDLLALARTYPIDGDRTHAQERGVGAMLDDEIIVQSMRKTAASAVQDLNLADALTALAPIKWSRYADITLFTNFWLVGTSDLYHVLCPKVAGHEDAVTLANALTYRYERNMEAILSHPGANRAVAASIDKLCSTIAANEGERSRHEAVNAMNQIASFLSGQRSPAASDRLRLSNKALQLVWENGANQARLRSAILRCAAAGNIDAAKPLLLTHPVRDFVKTMLDPEFGHVKANVIGEISDHFYGLTPPRHRHDLSHGADAPGDVSLLGA